MSWSTIGERALCHFYSSLSPSFHTHKHISSFDSEVKWGRTQNVDDGNVGRVKFSFVCSVFTLSRDSRLTYGEKKTKKKKKRRMEEAQRERKKRTSRGRTAQRKRKKNRETHADRYESFSWVLTDGVVIVVNTVRLSSHCPLLDWTWDIFKVIWIGSLTHRRDLIKAKKNGKTKITERATLKSVSIHYFFFSTC